MLNFKDKKVCVLGLGVEGLSSVRYLKNQGAQVAVADQKTQEDFDQEIFSEVQKLGVEFKLGKSYLENLENFDYLFRSPGVKSSLPALKVAESGGVKITSQTEIFLEEWGKQSIGVTGTKGKGTTASLVAEILKKDDREVFLGGNIGQPPLDFIDQMTKQSLTVLELSSFQLQDVKVSPHVGVVLMITSEHLDYHDTTAEYIEAKKAIVSFQDENDWAVINNDYPVSKSFAEGLKSQVLYFSKNSEVKKGAFVKNGEIFLQKEGEAVSICSTKEVLLPGEHNWENITAAIAAVSIFGVAKQPIKEVLITFKGLEHRLEIVQEVEGVKYYNDSFSTTPETAIAAIRSFAIPEIVILGGSSKNSDFSALAEEIVGRDNIKAVILVGVEGVRIEEAIEKVQRETKKAAKLKIIKGPKNMKEIVQNAFMIASPGDVVLLSPACASFDMFKNYKERGRLFKEEVNSLAQNSKTQT